MKSNIVTGFTFEDFSGNDSVVVIITAHLYSPEPELVPIVGSNPIYKVSVVCGGKNL